MAGFAVDVPGRRFVDTVDRVVGDAGGQPVLSSQGEGADSAFGGYAENEFPPTIGHGLRTQGLDTRNFNKFLVPL